ncbi:L-serine ammonia-lyase, iron-sulfur-dependent, subunit alpha [Faecalicoccus pleomorphus]|uniref:L-cysteine desulfidase family protein n=1 Tax=Faecalicoccus TaxID=1573536 RepID=UPI00232C47AE|nr:L-serine ammonia-lyase, iron-sulfur-dependent, subunit alpha [Faecalicoccus pleomorphus]MDB7989936.1 L-serine ammonia-lyase, iron-sulfur-dependent, subunit alpha [Faecalicoccus pleomorphus]MDB7994435.1 L-serine ammonia-lyase, iron-sulfur-dependent, subunit alpha [Faecalicoccus pleomorphus]
MTVNFIDLLKREMVPAQGCTEPIAVAYAASIASKELLPDKIINSIDLYLSGNIIKNALGVGIPGTGQVGLNIAAALGAVIAKPEKKLEILQGFDAQQLKQAESLLKEIKIEQKETKEKLYIEVVISGANHKVKVVIAQTHTNVIYIEKDGRALFEKSCDDKDEMGVNRTGLTVENIYRFIETVPFEKISFVLDCVEMNRKVSKEGLKGQYGLKVGNKVNQENSQMFVDPVTLQILSATCAASDARMDGCPLPIMTTAGSGNQGIACSMPVIKMAEIMKVNDDKLARALALSNLMVIHIKEFMGRLSPLCGAAIAGGTGACCAMTYLQGGNLNQINCAIRNMVASLSGMICDGAKKTCALKIATGTNAALLSSTLALNNISATSQDGIIFDDVEDTVHNIEKLVKEGLKQTDQTILSIMLNKKEGGIQHETSC